MDNVREVRDALLTSIDRWAPEVISTPPRSTLRCGIAQKCYGQVDRMLELCVSESVIACGQDGQAAVDACAGGKPVDRLTLGERVQVLERLDSSLWQAVNGLLTLPGSRVMGPKGIKLLHRLSKDRNRFAHDSADLQPAQVTELLARATELCESPLIRSVIALQERRSLI
jgi:hypothetical protein